MATSSPKRVRRAKKSAGSPAPGPMDPSCGHSGCGLSCYVRYCGPTSPMHNQHIIHAARGAAHVWAAAIVAGLAVVLTGAIAFSAVQAEEQQHDPTMLMLLALRRVEMRLDRMEPKINWLVANAKGEYVTSTKMEGDKDKMEKPPVANACVEQCGASVKSCMSDADSKGESCAKACVGADGANASVEECKAACAASRKSDRAACETTGKSCKTACTPQTAQ